jgi:hypothetical protein
MKHEFEHKFKVGDIVQFKGSINRLVINNVLSETCPGGTQILYRGVALHPDPNHYRWEDKSLKFIAIWDKPVTVNEAMLEEIKEVQ